jgi:NAD(P)-dependent dehydrogenase (short-subunit alcohol dehydrogenase family)
MFQSKVVIVTGSSSGIGARAAVRYAKEGATGVVISGRRAELLQHVKQECESVSNGKTKVKVVVGDVTQENVRNQLINDTVKEFGQLDVLVNNAAFGMNFQSMADCPIELYDKLFDVNVRSLVLLTQLAIPHLVKSKGNIVNISSGVAIKALPGTAYYCMTKAALDHYTRCLAVELGPQGVRVNTIRPGVIPDTDFDREFKKEFDGIRGMLEQQTPLRRTGTSDEVTDLILFLSSDRASFVTGDAISVDGGIILS